MAKDKKLEQLAALEHRQWMEWSKAVSRSVSKTKRDKWKKNWKPYNQLTEEEKEKDRVYARKVMKIMNRKSAMTGLFDDPGYPKGEMQNVVSSTASMAPPQIPAQMAQPTQPFSSGAAPMSNVSSSVGTQLPSSNSATEKASFAYELGKQAARCWEGYEPVPGKKPYAKGSCQPKGKKKK